MRECDNSKIHISRTSYKVTDTLMPRTILWIRRLYGERVSDGAYYTFTLSPL